MPFDYLGLSAEIHLCITPGSAFVRPDSALQASDRDESAGGGPEVLVPAVDHAEVGGLLLMCTNVKVVRVEAVME